MKKLTMFFVILSLLLLPLHTKAAEVTGLGVVTTANGSLNVRKNPTVTSAVIGSLQKGSYVILLSKSNNWYQVQYGKNAIGYVSASYVTAVEGRPAFVTASALNVRTGGSTANKVQDYLYKGETVVVLQTENGWSRVVYHGIKTGYVSAKYLSAGSVALSVPRYLQYDQRWGNVTLGTSGKTMAKIGCATTAIAMMESYKTGVTIYPDAMAKKLRYTSGGSVYWPENYKVVTNYSLPVIKNILDTGKPVLFGAKNSGGTQHWVVITGYSGSGSTARDFAINDPGSTSRTNLGQFLEIYPVFYKYFHY